MSQIKGHMGQMFVRIAGSMKSALTESQFFEKGVLTPEEYVLSGDYLVEKCRTWTWEGGDPSRRKSYLPEGKQYLITRNVPCLKRATSLEKSFTERSVYTDKEEEWTLAEFDDVKTDGDIPEMVDKIDERVDEESDEDEDIPDMDEFDDEENIQEAIGTEGQVSSENILSTRTYDITITYDNYYQSPRVLLMGYDEDNNPLSRKQMLEDISAEHAKKTVTFEPHPNLNCSLPSIHPCKHASVMHSVVTNLVEAGLDFKIEQALLLFLKFMQTIIPTIDYDYTREFGL